MFFDIGAGEIIGLAVLGLILVGPDRLPKFASDAAKTVRKIAKISQSATKELRENLGPDFEDLQPSDLHPKTFLKKHLAQALDQEENEQTITAKIDPDLL